MAIQLLPLGPAVFQGCTRAAGLSCPLVAQPTRLVCNPHHAPSPNPNRTPTHAPVGDMACELLGASWVAEVRRRDASGTARRNAGRFLRRHPPCRSWNSYRGGQGSRHGLRGPEACKGGPASWPACAIASNSLGLMAPPSPATTPRSQPQFQPRPGPRSHRGQRAWGAAGGVRAVRQERPAEGHAAAVHRGGRWARCEARCGGAGHAEVGAGGCRLRCLCQRRLRPAPVRPSPTPPHPMATCIPSPSTSQQRCL